MNGTQKNALFVWEGATLVAHYAAFLYENPGARRAWESREEKYHNDLDLLMPGVNAGSDYEQLVVGYLNQLDQSQN